MAETIVRVIDLVPGEVCELPYLQADALDRNTFWTEYVCKHKPILIKKAVQDWPALDKWCRPEYLEALCGDEQAGMARMFNPFFVLPTMFHAGKIGDHIEEMHKSSDDQTYSIPAFDIPQKWAKDLGTYSFLGEEVDKKPRAFQTRRLFVYKNASTEWHYHITDETLTTQLVGVKRFSIFHLTNENWDVFSELIKHNCHHLSCRQEYFAQQAPLVKYEGVLRPGDALYLPPFWWHGIDPIDAKFGITLAHCFRTPLRRLGSWGQEPATRDAIRSMPSTSKSMALALLLLSSMTRLVAGERW
jgi:cupin-like protein